VFQRTDMGQRKRSLRSRVVMTPRRESPPCQGFASIQSGRERVLWITMSRRTISFFVACNLVALGLVVFYLDVFDATRF
jgi:hypothetical protein